MLFAVTRFACELPDNKIPCQPAGGYPAWSRSGGRHFPFLFYFPASCGKMSLNFSATSIIAPNLALSMTER
jgi:hypothetical protein